jgi:probable HAF family extracellular repeat protein
VDSTATCAGEGINDLGQVVGFSANSTGTSRAIRWIKTHGMQDLNKLIPPEIWMVADLRDRDKQEGQITGRETSLDKTVRFCSRLSLVVAFCCS